MDVIFEMKYLYANKIGTFQLTNKFISQQRQHFCILHSSNKFTSQQCKRKKKFQKTINLTFSL